MAQILCPNCSKIVESTSPSPSQCPECGHTFPVAEDSTLSPFRAAPTVVAPPENELPHQIGRYLVMRQLGKGGFGIVYLAKDPQLDQLVAIKIPRADTGRHPAALRRFEREGRNAARLRRDGIARVLTVEYEGTVPFIVSEFIEGVTLADRLKDGPRYSFNESAQLVATLADAIEYAHSQDVIHRDIKPSNVLIGTDGRPWLLDFGLAVRESIDESIAMPHHIIGTPAYMSPEQASGKKVDRRCDVYSLGVVLYQLITGDVPFHGEMRMVLRQVIEEDPRNPRSLNADIRLDLETVCETAMLKEVDKRYQTADKLAQELGCYLRGEPIEARPITRVDRLWRWCKRNKLTSSLVASIAAVLMLSALGATLMAASEHRHRTQVEQLLDEKNELLSEKSELLSKSYVEKADRYLSPQTQSEESSPIRALPWLYAAFENDQQNARRREASRIRLGAALRHLPRVEQVWSHKGGITAAGISPLGDRFVTGNGEGTVFVWDLAKDGPVTPALVHPGSVTGTTFSSDSKSIATGCSDGSIRVWEAATGKLLVGPFWDAGLTKTVSTTEPTHSVLLSAVGQSLLSVRGENAQVWDITTGHPIGTSMTFPGLGSIRLADSGKLVVAAGRNSSIDVWDVQTGKKKQHLQDAPSSLAPVLARDGITLAATATPESVCLWNCKSGQKVAMPLVHGSPVSAFEFSPNSMSLATATADGVISLWKASDGTLLWKQKISTARIGRLHFSSDGDNLAAVYPQGHMIWIINVDDGKSVAEPIEISSQIQLAGWAHGNATLLTMGADGAIRLWQTEAADSALQLSHSGSVVGSAVSDNPQKLLTVDRDGTCCIVDLDRPELARLSDVRSVKTGIDKTAAVALSADGSKAALADSRGAVSLCDVATGTRIRDVDPGGPIGRPMLANRLVFLADGRSLIHLTARFQEHSCRINVWDLASGDRLRSEKLDLDGEFRDFDLQPKGSLCAVAGGKQVVVWDAASGRRLGSILSHDRHVTSCRLSGDGARLLSGCDDGVARVWDLQSAKITTASQKQPQAVRCVGFSPDGTRFATGCVDGLSRIWSTTDARPVTGFLRQGAPVTGCFFSPDSRWLLTTNGDARSGFSSEPIVRGWDASTGETLFILPLMRVARHRVKAPASPFAPLELQLATLSDNGRRLHVVLRDGLFTTLSLKPDARVASELLREIGVRSGTRPDRGGGLSIIDADDLARVFRREK